MSAAQKVAAFCTAQVLAANLDGNSPYVVSDPVNGCPGSYDIGTLAFSPTGTAFATACGDDTLRLWNAARPFQP